MQLPVGPDFAILQGRFRTRFETRHTEGIARMAKVRIGFVGTGSMGQMAHLRNYLLLEDAEVVAISEARKEMGAKVARRYDIPHFYPDFRQMLDAHELDGAVVSQKYRNHAALLPAWGTAAATGAAGGEKRRPGARGEELGATTSQGSALGWLPVARSSIDSGRCHASACRSMWTATGSTAPSFACTRPHQVQGCRGLTRSVNHVPPAYVRAWLLRLAPQATAPRLRVARRPSNAPPGFD